MNNTPDTPEVSCQIARMTSTDVAKVIESLGYELANLGPLSDKYMPALPLSDKHMPALLGVLHIHVSQMINQLLNSSNHRSLAAFTAAGVELDWHGALKTSLTPSFLMATSIKDYFDATIDEEDFDAGAANVANVGFLATGLIADLCRYHSGTPSHDRDEIYRLTKELAQELNAIADNHLFDPPGTDNV